MVPENGAAEHGPGGQGDADVHGDGHGECDDCHDGHGAHRGAGDEGKNHDNNEDIKNSKKQALQLIHYLLPPLPRHSMIYYG